MVKSPPELWAECSDAASLARHLTGSFGEIKITRLEPETAVAWEGERASGAVRIEPSAWGTRVTLTAQMRRHAAEEEPPDEVAAVVGEEPAEVAAEEHIVVEDAMVIKELVADEEIPDASDPQPPAPRRRLVARMRAFLRPGPAMEAVVATEPSEPPEVSEPEVPVEPEPAEAEEPAEEPVAKAAPAPEAESEPDIDPGPAVDPEAVLTAALDSLGQAHHRPFSRA